MLYQSISSVNLLQASISVIYQGDSFSTSFAGLKPFAQVFVYVAFYCCFLIHNSFCNKNIFFLFASSEIDGVIMLLGFDKVYKSTATV